jgi:hypothetical protein
MTLIRVQRDSDQKIFTNDISNAESIIEIHFCASYTQVIVQELKPSGYQTKDIICEPIGTTANPIDLIATQNDDTGKFLN